MTVLLRILFYWINCFVLLNKSKTQVAAPIDTLCSLSCYHILNRVMSDSEQRIDHIYINNLSKGINLDIMLHAISL